MRVVADSGSTKTLWRIRMPGGELREARSQGINPYYLSTGEIEQVVLGEVLPQLPPGSISRLDFYGAGCSVGVRQQTVATVLGKCFPGARVTVENDLLGSARATCGRREGIACVLGTGSGSCVYDGERIAANIPSLGFILGDEGSGAYIGKRFVAAFLRGEIPPTTAEAFQREYAITKEIVLENVIRGVMPSRYLAGFARYLSRMQDDPTIYRLMYECLDDFVQHYVIRYPEFRSLPVNFVGSVAFHNQAILKAVARDHDFTLGTVLASPIEGLTRYHFDEGEADGP